jgi:hypothetical protein
MQRLGTGDVARELSRRRAFPKSASSPGLGGVVAAASSRTLSSRTVAECWGDVSARGAGEVAGCPAPRAASERGR